MCKITKEEIKELMQRDNLTTDVDCSEYEWFCPNHNCGAFTRYGYNFVEYPEFGWYNVKCSECHLKYSIRLEHGECDVTIDEDQ